MPTLSEAAVKWAGDRAKGDATLGAARGLLGGTRALELVVNLVEISRARVGRALDRHVLLDIDEFQHAWRHGRALGTK